jgi:tetratricopeptide (TPR) repeat protein
MDWGLAKDLTFQEVADRKPGFSEETGFMTAPTVPLGSMNATQTIEYPGAEESTAERTQPGQVLGTPAYMAPEQARGEATDTRADVFALGGILCAILTGQPPFAGTSPLEMVRRAADLAEANGRLDRCGADAELVALCRHCLNPRPLDRPADGQAVADGLMAYLGGVQDKLRQAELAEAEAKAKAAEEAKRRRLTLALAATVLLGVTLGGGGWLYVKNERDARAAQVTRDVNDALAHATALREKAKAATTGGTALFAQAREQAQRALALVENGPADETLVAEVKQLQAELNEEEKDRTLVSALDEARLAQAETADDKPRFAPERAVPRFRQAFRAYGLPAGEGEPRVAAERIGQRPAAVREAIVAALDEWDALAGDPEYRINEPHRKWLRAVLEAAEPEGWGRQVRAARLETDQEKRRAALQALAKSARVADLPARALTQLARQLCPAQAAELLSRAQRHYPADFWVNQGVGAALMRVAPPELGEAARFLTAAVALRPESPGAHVNLGAILNAKGDYDGAIACYHKALELDPKIPVPHYNLGNTLADKGQADAAIACWRKALELDPNYAQAHANMGAALSRRGEADEAIRFLNKALELDPKIVLAHHQLGVALAAKGQLDEAIVHYLEAIQLDPKHAKAHSNLGTALADKGQMDKAIAWQRKAVALDPKYTHARVSLGAALWTKGRLDEAIDCLRKAIDLDPKDAAAHSGLGTVLADRGQLDEAIAWHRKAIELDPKNAKAHVNLGIALVYQRQLDAAIVCFRKAMELAPKLAPAYANLGTALRLKGQLEEAIVSCRKAIEFDPKSTFAHINLGTALRTKGRVDEAMGCFRKALDLDPRDANAHFCLGNGLRDKRQFDAASASYKKAIELKPNFAEAHCNLGHALSRQGCFAESLAAFQRGHELGSKRRGWPYPSAEWVRRAERMAALEAKLSAFLKGEFQPKDASQRLGLIGVCQAKKLHHAGARLSLDIFAADPKLADHLQAGHRYNAACLAALAASGQGEDAAKLDDSQKARLRKQAADWLRADLTAYTKLLNNGPPTARPFIVQQLQHSQKNGDLAGLRDPKELPRLPKEEQAAWLQHWSAVETLRKNVAMSYNEETRKGALSAMGGEQAHELKMTAGTTYSIDMISTQFDTYLRVEDAKKKMLAENDDIAPNDLNSRIVFTAREDGVYRIIATSFQQRGRGAYTLVIRGFRK